VVEIRNIPTSLACPLTPIRRGPRGERWCRAKGDIQRFLGQCAMAAVKHDVVIGLCGYRGTLNKEFEDDSEDVKNWNKKQNIRLVFVKVP
jgi:hypothetical protein